MIYLEIRERLGNQFFQYAFARSLMEKYNDKLSINFEAVKNRNDEEHGWINHLTQFNVSDYEIVTHKNYNFFQKFLLMLHDWYIKGDSHVVVNRKQKRIARLLSKFGIYYLFDGYMEFATPLKIFKDKILIGYFESPKYSKDINGILRNEFEPKQPLLERNRELYDLILSTESVCVTIRRGDFLHPMYKDEVYICDEDYFYRGIKRIKEMLPQSVLFIFSDEIDWVKENMSFSEKVYFESGLDPLWEKIRLMKACKHFVISNSSFSWWVQHLSGNENKIVIAPQKWRKDGRPSDIYEDNWVLIETS